MDIFTWVWIAWGVYFAIVETLSIMNKRKGDTLSENIWKWFAVTDPKAKLRTLRRAGLLVGMLWLLIHFITGGWI